MNLASRKSQWPLGRGFERFYGFLGGETNQWYPDLVYDNHPVEQPSLPEEGYHLTVDLTDKAIEFIARREGDRARQAVLPLLLPRRRHAPHHAPKEWADKYKGKFDMGYEAYREHVFERQKKLGIVTEKAELSPINPYADEKSADGKPWPELDTVRPWDSLSDDEKRLFCRMAEVYAGFLSHADHADRPAARLPRGDRRARQHDDRARLRQRRLRRGRPERLGQREQVLQRPPGHDRGEPAVPRRARQPAHLQPLPDRLGVGVQHAVQALEALRELGGRHGRPDDRLLAEADRGDGRSAASTPTRSTSSRRSTSASASTPPEVVKGYTQHPIEGVSFAADASTTPTRRPASRRSSTRCSARGRSGTRAGRRPRVSPSAPEHVGRATRRQRWELFDTENDPSECHDLAAEQPGQAAGADRALVGTRPAATARCRSRTASAVEILAHRAAAALEAAQPLRLLPRRLRDPGVGRARTSATARTRSRSRSTIDTEEAGGVLFAQGSRFGGHALYIKDGKLKYVYNFVGLHEQVVESTERRPDRTRRPLGVVRARGRRHARRGHADAPHPRREGRRGADQDPARASSRSPAKGSTSAGTAAEPVTDDYPGERPWAFVGGTIEQARSIDVSGDAVRRPRRRRRQPAFARD